MQFFRLLFFLILTFLGSISLASAPVNSCDPELITSEFIQKNFDKTSSYKTTFQSCSLFSQASQKYISVTAIRNLTLASQKFVLFVNNLTLQTQILPQNCFQSCSDISAYINNQSLPNEFSSTYLHALIDTASAPFLTHGDGIKHETSGSNKVYLTIDLCPSRKALDRELFDKIKMTSQQQVPVTIAMSGLWQINHTADFQELLRLEKVKKISITWVNHSFSHPYRRNLPDDQNFLLMDHVNFYDEVISNEINFLANGIIPTVFFRFPGLISNEKLVLSLKNWGLIPLSTDAWLANEQKPLVGSFILVHGNGNEPQGLNLLYNLISSWPDLTHLWGNLSDAFRLY